MKKKKEKVEEEKYYSQWYWQEALMYPYKKTKAWYYGPRLDWMHLTNKNEKKYIKKNN